MEYVAQRKILRQPITHVYKTPWDLIDLDGGCQIWRRFREKKIHELGPVGDGGHCLQIKQFEMTKIKHSTAESMWRLRTTGSADREYWRQSVSDKDERLDSNLKEYVANQKAPLNDINASYIEWEVESTDLNGRNERALKYNSDSDDEDDDDDDNGTIYSRAHFDSPSLYESFTTVSRSSSSSSAESYTITPCTLASMSLAYTSFDWTGDIYEAEAVPGPTVSARAVESALSNTQAESHPFLTAHVHNAWLRYESERLSQEIESNRSLSQRFPQELRLSRCHWEPLRLPLSLESFKARALQRPTTGRCAYERTPLIILTSTDNETFELREVIQILTDAEISAIHHDRASLAMQAEICAARYIQSHANSAAERLATAAARAWWHAEHETRSAQYVDRTHDEAREEALLMRRIEREAETFLWDEERAWAVARCSAYRERADAGLVEALAGLKVGLARDGLVRERGKGKGKGGWYGGVGAGYSVWIGGRVWRSCLERGVVARRGEEEEEVVVEWEDQKMDDAEEEEEEEEGENWVAFMLGFISDV